MKVRMIAIVFALALSGAFFVLGTARVSHAEDASSCTLEYFRADVAQGPNKGLSLLGKLTLNIDANGGVTGALTPDGGSADIKVTGQVNGRAINLAFDVSQTDKPNWYIFGVGTSWNAAKDCNSVLGGPFAGPDAGDLGDWLSCQRRGAKDDCQRGG